MPGNNVQRFREARLMSKAELARKSGLSTLTIDRVESGRPCRLDTKRKILQALDVRVVEQDRIFGALNGDAVEIPKANGADDRSTEMNLGLSRGGTRP